MNDYCELRNLILAINEININYDNYKFYYDETNNIRSLITRESDFNNDLSNDFVLGGIVTKEDIPDEIVKQLIDSMSFQPNMNEFKLKNMGATGNFFNYMKSSRIFKILNWIDDNKVLIHFQTINLLHYALADIVDAFIDDNCTYYVDDIKTVLTYYASKDIENIHKILRENKYPNLDKEKINEFCNDFIKWIEDIDSNNEFDNFYLELLRQTMKSKSNPEKFIILFDNVENKLIESFISVYINKLFIFNNSFHLFDREKVIEKEISKEKIIFDGKILNNYRFEESEKNRLLQISDVVVGVIGKLFTTANQMTLKEINDICLTDFQKKNIKLLSKIIDNSAEENNFFIGRTANKKQCDKVSKILSKE